MQRNSHLYSAKNQVPIEVFNPQILNPLKPKKQISFRKRKSQIEKQKKIFPFQREKQPEDNPLYVGLQNEENSKNNEKIIGPWIRPQIQRPAEKSSKVQNPLTQNKIKFMNRFSQNSFSSKKSYSNQIALNNVNSQSNPKNITSQKFFMKVLSVRKAVLEQQDDTQIQLPKIKNSGEFLKLRSTCSFKAFPSWKSNDNLLKKQNKPQIRKLISYKSSENLIERKKELSHHNSLLQRKLNGIAGDFNISLLKAKNIELHNFMNSSKFASIIHTKKKS